MDYDRLRELQEKFEENPRRYFAPLANEYRKGGQPKRAIEICRAQLGQMPGHMSGLIVFGQALYEASEFDEARQVFQRALALDPENLIALRSLGDMSLQSGNTAEARTWYTRLLDADPKDTAVIALVSEIDASADAAPVEAPSGVPVDSDAGDQAIPFIADASGQPIEPSAELTAGLETNASAEPAVAAQSSEPTSPPEPVAPPMGLERHYPVESPAPEASSTSPIQAESQRVEEPTTRSTGPSAPASSSSPSEPMPFEDEIPLGAEGLKSAISATPRGAESLRSLLDQPQAAIPTPRLTPAIERPVTPAPEPPKREPVRGEVPKPTPVPSETPRPAPSRPEAPAPAPARAEAPAPSPPPVRAEAPAQNPPPVRAETPTPSPAPVRPQTPPPQPAPPASPRPEPTRAQTPPVAPRPEPPIAKAPSTEPRPEAVRGSSPAEKPASEQVGIDGIRGRARPGGPVGAEGLHGNPQPQEPVGTEGLTGKPVASPLAGATGGRSDDDNAALDAWTPPPGANVHERVESRKEDRMFSGASPEPFVNETMAQLYLQQGYRQLALKVYYQLAETRPNDQGLKDRIAEIEAADRAAHPDAVATPRPPAPALDTRRETPRAERPERESIESPARDEPRAEPEGIAARQPSIKEFFATLGRRRAPRVAAGPGNPPRSGSHAVTEPPPPPLATAAPAASLDAVFAGATVNPADSRAASRLAGAFSGAQGTPSRTPPTPPTPTPRVNPRLPHTQESDEDVAKFRAWLDGLTGE